MIIDGHAHTYPGFVADKVVHSFTAFHRMEPTGSIGRGTIDDLVSRMDAAGVAYTVTANFSPEKSVRKTNTWSLEAAKVHPRLIPLVAVCPGMAVEEVAAYFASGALGIKMHTGIQGFDPMDGRMDGIYAFAARRLQGQTWLPQ